MTALSGVRSSWDMFARNSDLTLAPSRELFHPGSQVSGLADDGVVHTQITADGSDHHLARVEPDPNLNRDAVRATRLLCPPANRCLHVQRGVTSPDGMILMRERRAEERHDPIAHHLIHCALVAVDRLHHAFEDGVKDLSRLLGITVGEEFHRALQVGEEHRDLLALALESGLGSEDLLGEMLRRVGLGRREARLGSRPRCDGLPAL